MGSNDHGRCRDLRVLGCDGRRSLLSVKESRRGGREKCGIFATKGTAKWRQFDNQNINEKKKLQGAEVEMGHKKSFFLVRVKDLVFLNLREMLSFSKNSPKKTHNSQLF